MSESWETMERLLAWKSERQMKVPHRKRGSHGKMFEFDVNGDKIPDGKARQ